MSSSVLGLDGDELEEEEEDEPLPLPDDDDVLPTPSGHLGGGDGEMAADASATPPAIMALPDFQPMPDMTESDDVPALMAALAKAEERIVGYQSREAEYLNKLAKREKEVVDLKSALQDLAHIQSPAATWARKVLLDPAVALEIRTMRRRMKELEDANAQLEERVAAKEFSAESATGEKLLAKNQKLYQENKDLVTRLDRVRQLEDDKARLKAEVEKLKKTVAENQGYVESLDEERGLFATMVYTLKKQLQAYEQQVTQLQQQMEEMGGGGGDEDMHMVGGADMEGMDVADLSETVDDVTENVDEMKGE